MADTLAVALKEWELQIDAMLRGHQPFLLRKGGILESSNEFELEHARFLFFPTVVHQDPRMVKEPWRAGIQRVREEPDKVAIRAYGEVVKIFEVPPGDMGRRRLEQLGDLYVWDTPLLDMRFAYRPEKPLYLVVVRAFELPRPEVIQNTLEYAGCKSWVPLQGAIEVEGARAAMPDERLAGIVERTERTLDGEV
jgi:hypothetical protein